MSIYLVQHGKNLPKDQDPEQHLSQEGKSEVERIAQTAKQYRVQVAKIEHSPKVRAEETASIFAEALQPAKGIAERENIKALDDVTAVVKEVDDLQDYMLVGHLPFMEKLASHLITGSEENLVIKFQNGGIVCLDQDMESGSWFIKWTLLPRID